MMYKPGDKKKIIAAGSFVTFLALIIMIFIFLIGEQSGIFEKRILLTTQVTNAKNLKEGAPVQLKGVKVGTVDRIEFTDVDTLTIHFFVMSRYQSWVKKDAYINFRTMGVLGDRFIEILGGSPTSAMVENDDKLVLKIGTEMDQVMAKGEDILAQSTKTIARLNSILEEIDGEQINRAVINISKTVKTADDLIKSINTKNLNSSLANLDKASTQLAEISTRIKEGPGTIHSLIYDPTVHDDLQTLLGGAKRNKILNYFIKESIKKNQN